MTATNVEPARPQRRLWSGGARATRYAWGYFFVAPWVLGFLIFTAYPMIYSAVISFTQFDLLTPPKFIGAAN